MFSACVTKNAGLSQQDVLHVPKCTAVEAETQAMCPVLNTDEIVTYKVLSGIQYLFA